MADAPRHRVVIVGGGFGGLYTAKALGGAAVDVTLIDKRNFHLFQPLLYQVATGGLSAGDISSPIRAILSRYRNVKVLMDEVTTIDSQAKRVILQNGEIEYDTLVVATGVSHHYFGNDDWAAIAPGLKTVEDALEMRRRIFLAFEAAEKETDAEKRRAWLTFVVVGGGPTGVELAGALAELAYSTLKSDFRNIDTSEARILLLEGLDRVLPPYPSDLSAAAADSLERLGVTVQTKTLVTKIADDIVTIKQGDSTEEIPARTILWAAGVKASAMGKVLADRAQAELDRVGRVMVAPNLSLPAHPDTFRGRRFGTLRRIRATSRCLEVAPVAMQQGSYCGEID
ncbi:MAG: NAD(P)/FAD-dependent oxidoreductase, partial [Leptolyngbyaceae cyanobacterium SM1_3_5]|nr:NAD(P)/FAD-dependent oxidoreductase [Leptolyngbyaceae cyanobacterium SM1_3_5]